MVIDGECDAALISTPEVGSCDNALVGRACGLPRSIVKIRDVIKMLEDDGWTVVRQRGSHRQFKHASKPGLVTVPGKPGDDLAPGTLNSVLKQAGLKQ